MAVPFISTGYDSTATSPYTETVWAEAFPSIGSASYGVRGAGDWKVSAVSGADRTVAIAAGRGWGHGVTDETELNDTVQLGTVTSGSRWDLIAVRRDWNPTAGVSKFVSISGGADALIPGGRVVGPGDIDDQPLALVQVTAGQTQPTSIIDLRVWAGDGGGLVAAHARALQYLEALGTRVTVGAIDWVRTLGANNMPEWRRYYLQTELARGIEVAVTTNKDGVGTIKFDPEFPEDLRSFTINDSTSNSLVGAVICKVSMSNSDRTKGVFIAYGQNSANKFVPLGGAGLYVTYTATGI